MKKKTKYIHVLSYMVEIHTIFPLMTIIVICMYMYLYDYIIVELNRHLYYNNALQSYTCMRL